MNDVVKSDMDVIASFTSVGKDSFSFTGVTERGKSATFNIMEDGKERSLDNGGGMIS